MYFISPADDLLNGCCVALADSFVEKDATAGTQGQAVEDVSLLRLLACRLVYIILCMALSTFKSP